MAVTSSEVAQRGAPTAPLAAVTIAKANAPKPVFRRMLTIAKFVHAAHNSIRLSAMRITSLPQR